MKLSRSIAAPQFSLSLRTEHGASCTQGARTENFSVLKVRFGQVSPFPYKCKVDYFLELEEEGFIWATVKEYSPLG
jgi:hypothetical protein